MSSHKGPAAPRTPEVAPAPEPSCNCCKCQEDKFHFTYSLVPLTDAIVFQLQSCRLPAGVRFSNGKVMIYSDADKVQVVYRKETFTYLPLVAAEALCPMVMVNFPDVNVAVNDLHEGFAQFMKELKEEMAKRKAPKSDPSTAAFSRTL